MCFPDVGLFRNDFHRENRDRHAKASPKEQAVVIAASELNRLRLGAQFVSNFFGCFMLLLATCWFCRIKMFFFSGPYS